MISVLARPQILARAPIATYWTLLVRDNMIYLVECLDPAVPAEPER